MIAIDVMLLFCFIVFKFGKFTVSKNTQKEALNDSHEYVEGDNSEYDPDEEPPRKRQQTKTTCTTKNKTKTKINKKSIKKESKKGQNAVKKTLN